MWLRGSGGKVILIGGRGRGVAKGPIDWWERGGERHRCVKLFGGRGEMEWERKVILIEVGGE